MYCYISKLRSSVYCGQNIFNRLEARDLSIVQRTSPPVIHGQLWMCTLWQILGLQPKHIKPKIQRRHLSANLAIYHLWVAGLFISSLKKIFCLQWCLRPKIQPVEGLYTPRVCQLLCHWQLFIDIDKIKVVKKSDTSDHDFQRNIFFIYCIFGSKSKKTETKVCSFITVSVSFINLKKFSFPIFLWCFEIV